MYLGKEEKEEVEDTNVPKVITPSKRVITTQRQLFLYDTPKSFIKIYRKQMVL